MPLVTVSEVLRFALPPGSTLLAGSPGLGNAVSWARLLRARPASLGRIEHGEVWLLSSAALQLVGDRRAVARMVREMAQAGVVAFVTAEPLGDEALVEAERAGTPVVLLPPGAQLVELEKAVVSFLVDRDRAIALRAQDVYERLLATLVEDRGPELLAEVVHEVTGKVVYLLDEHFQPTAQSGGDQRTAEAVAELRRRYWAGQLGNVHERLVSIRPSSATSEPSRSAPLGLALRPLTLRGAVDGYLAMLGSPDDFGDFDHQVADRAASVLAIELAKQSAVVEARLRVQGDFLQELLDEAASPDGGVVERARRLGYDLTRPHLAFVLRPRAPAAASPDGGAAAGRQYQRFVDLARRRLVLADIASLLRERDGTIQALMPCPPEVRPDHPDSAIEWVERLRSGLEAGLAPDVVPIVAGIGRLPHGELSHHTAMREAARAAEIAASMGAGPATLHFARLGALRLIFHLTGSPELRAFQRDVLGPLEISDTTRRSEFLRTLDAFLKAGGNHMRAARDLHIHRNTLIYRLERIQELLGGADLEDAETRLSLQLALKIRAATGGSSEK